MQSQRSREGYLLIDHRYSPGITADLPRPPGMIDPVGPGQTFESATSTCGHCGVPHILNPNRSRPRGYCFKCSHYVCDMPWCNDGCHPFEATLERAYEHAMRGWSYNKEMTCD